MFNFKQLFVACTFLMLSNGLFAQTTQKFPQIVTMPSTINTIDINVNVEKSAIQILKVKGSRLFIETSVALSEGKTQLLEYLIQSGRYNLDIDTDPSNGKITIRRTAPKQIVLIKGAECQEEISYKIHVPETIQFVNNLNEANPKTLIE